MKMFGRRNVLLVEIVQIIQKTEWMNWSQILLLKTKLPVQAIHRLGILKKINKYLYKFKNNIFGPTYVVFCENLMLIFSA